MSTYYLSGLGLGTRFMPRYCCALRGCFITARKELKYFLGEFQGQKFGLQKNLRFYCINLSLFMKIRLRNYLYLGKSPCLL